MDSLIHRQVVLPHTLMESMPSLLELSKSLVMCHVTPLGLNLQHSASGLNALTAGPQSLVYLGPSLGRTRAQ